MTERIAVRSGRSRDGRLCSDRHHSSSPWVLVQAF